MIIYYLSLLLLLGCETQDVKYLGLSHPTTLTVVLEDSGNTLRFDWDYDSDAWFTLQYYYWVNNSWQDIGIQDSISTSCVFDTSNTMWEIIQPEDRVMFRISARNSFTEAHSDTVTAPVITYHDGP